MAVFKRRKKKAGGTADRVPDGPIAVSDTGEIIEVKPEKTELPVLEGTVPDGTVLDGAEGTTLTGRRSSAVVTGKRRSGIYDFSKMDAVVEELSSSETSADETLDVSKLSRKERKALRDAMEGSISSYPHLMAMKPSEGFVFHSDYFQVDNFYGCVLAFFHDDGAQDHFSEFWGINEIPSGLDSDVTTVLFSSIARMPENWIEANMKTVDRLDKLEANEQAVGGTMQTKRRSAKISDDMMQITAELQNGSSYLSVHQRLLVKAPTLESLERNIEKIKRLYVERFGTITITPYPGEQKQELSNLLAPNRVKRGTGFYFTSAEYAGSYSLVTNGLNDPNGEYVGYMVGDVNNSAVLFDVDDYAERVVCADSTISQAEILKRSRVVDMWGSKISQAALLNNHRVVHIVLNDADLDVLGPKLERITSKVDMVSGDINMFEFFGNVEDELSLYSAQIEKISLMAEEAQRPTDEERAIIRGQLSSILERFYVDAGMWSPNAKENRDRLRLVGLNHNEVPLLHHFISYLDQEHKRLIEAKAKDNDQLAATNKLSLLFKAMLENNGDLFDRPTSSSIDGVDQSRRVIYNFARLRQRGQGVAMAQLVNVIGFAVRNLGYGDTLIIHGAERISPTVQEYMDMQIDQLIQGGGRVVFLYNSVEKMIDQADFNGFVKADYTILGPMTADVVPKYQDRMNQRIPPDLQQLITATGRNQSYLRRKFSNVVFYTDLGLGLSGRTLQDSTGGSVPGRGRGVVRRKGPSPVPQERPTEPVLSDEAAPVATNAGVKMDEAETEEGGVQLARPVGGSSTEPDEAAGSTKVELPSRLDEVLATQRARFGGGIGAMKVPVDMGNTPRPVRGGGVANMR